MVRLTAVIGGLLVLTGVIGFVVTGAASVTALIPAFVGLLLLLAAFIGSRSEGARRHAMHAALLISLLGALGSLMNVVKLGEVFAGTAERPAAIIASTVLLVLTVVHLVLGIRSFVAARRSR